MTNLKYSNQINKGLNVVKQDMEHTQVFYAKEHRISIILGRNRWKNEKFSHYVQQEKKNKKNPKHIGCPVFPTANVSSL